MHNILIMVVPIFLSLLFVFESFPATAQQRNSSNITLASSLSPTPTNNSYWSSSSGRFAFGFYQKGNGFAVGIWYAQIRRKTVVWTANRDDPPLPNDTVLLLSNLSPYASSASLLDTGNFVIYNSNSVIIWQSFDFPTDTLLPGQHLLAGKNMTSSISEADHSSGKFLLIMLNDGNLVQYPRVGPYTAANAYWNSSTYQAGDGVSLNLNDKGLLYLLNISGVNIMNLTGENARDYDVMMYRVTIDADGLLRLYSHGLEDQNGDWKIEWSSFSNRCDRILCGPNQYCNITNQEPVCVNSSGFRPIAPEGSGFRPIAQEGERNLCCNKKKDDQIKLLTILSVAFLTTALVVLAISGIVIYKYRNKGYKRMSNQGNTNGLIEDVTLRSFTFSDLVEATNGFAEELGRGAFGTVFKGVLPNSQTVVAVKRLEIAVAEGEREFENEMKIIGRTHHRNLLQLLGYCHEGSDHKLLVYEYMSNGSLADFLFRSSSQRKLTWEQRIGISLDVAKGIRYLHEDCKTQIIHCDIKPENILMDENGHAKIADFGLAKLLTPYQTRTFTRIRGTRGYVAPEWHRNLPVTVKADVYSFGIVLLEIICCRRSLNMDAPEEEMVLVDWVYDCFVGGEVEKLVQDEEEVDRSNVERMVRVGLLCIQDEPSARPLMKNVVLMIEGTIDIPTPPIPTCSLSSTWAIYCKSEFLI